MAITIDWGTKIIDVPKADLTLIQPSPEVRELDVDWFRLELKDLEDDEEGMTFPDTHNHFTEVTLAGLTYARIIEIINGYTVEFEDGQYTVNCVGANHNLSDVRVANQVSLIVNNAAGLINSAQIEYSSFLGGVHIDVVNGVVGTLFPRGTAQMPVNNLADAKLIAVTRGFESIHILGNIEFTNGDSIDGYEVIGEGCHITILTFSSSVSTDEVIIRHATVQGILDGHEVHIYDSHVENLVGFSGMLFDCLLMGNITLARTEDCHFINCVSAVPGSGTPVIDMGGSGRGLGVRAYAGGIKLINKTGSEPVSIDFISGQLKLASTVTDGEIVVRGAGWISEPYHTGTTTIRDDGLINPDVIWDEPTADHTTAGTFGEKVGKKLLTLAKFVGLK